MQDHTRQSNLKRPDIPKKHSARDEAEARELEQDREMEREYRALAQWLIDVYHWKRKQSREQYPQGDVDRKA
jgi:hypothetical protein